MKSGEVDCSNRTCDLPLLNMGPAYMSSMENAEVSLAIPVKFSSQSFNQPATNAIGIAEQHRKLMMR